MYALRCTYAGESLEGDHTLIGLLIESELFYKINITDKNRENISALESFVAKKTFRVVDAILGSRDNNNKSSRLTSGGPIEKDDIKVKPRAANRSKLWDETSREE